MMVIGYRRFGAATILGGGFAGVIGAILMGAALSVYSAATGAGWSLPMQTIAATYYGPMAYVGAQGVTAIGVVTHIVIGGLFGVLFAMLAARARSARALFWWGIPYGVAVWAFMTYVIVPVFDATMWPRVMMISVLWFFVHWIYGAFTGVFIPPLRRAFASRDEEPIAG